MAGFTGVEKRYIHASRVKVGKQRDEKESVCVCHGDHDTSINSYSLCPLATHQLPFRNHLLKKKIRKHKT